MTTDNTKQLQNLKESLKAIEELKVPEHLQDTALSYLLGGSLKVSATPGAHGSTPAAQGTIVISQPQAQPLREFIAEFKPKGAVSEIPCLLYWFKVNESQDSASEEKIVELYRRAGLKPPKNVTQSLRDLCSKKYGRVDSLGGGLFKLSRVGEDFVLHDVKSA